jgi:signal transduction histidine kinase
LNIALEQQTTTAEMLRMISHSGFNLDAVLNSLVESAMSLCTANSGYLVTHADGEYRTRAAKGSPPPLERLMKSQVFKPGRRSITPRVLRSGAVEMISDTREESDFAYKDLTVNRSALGVPLIRNGDLVGVFVLGKLEPGGFTERQIELVKTFADQAVIAIGNMQLLTDLEQRTAELDRSLEALRLAQDRLIQTEKLTSLGQLAAGIAHEIRNPLNFVSNFSKLSIDLIAEMNQALSETEMSQELREEVEELTQTLSDNLGKIRRHGLRADSIVRNMLLHARQDGGARRAVDLNSMIEESLNLAYHGARAERSDFNINVERCLDQTIGKVEVYPQDLTRVLLNLFSNGFYAACARAGEPGFEPCLKVSTKAVGDRVEIRVRDNGNGVPEALREKLFTPFFTTKPAGEGTGLGLSLSYEIIVKQHDGSLSFDSQTGQFTEFLIALPYNADRER